MTHREMKAIAERNFKKHQTLLKNFGNTIEGRFCLGLNNAELPLLALYPHAAIYRKSEDEVIADIYTNLHFQEKIGADLEKMAIYGDWVEKKKGVDFIPTMPELYHFTDIETNKGMPSIYLSSSDIYTPNGDGYIIRGPVGSWNDCHDTATGSSTASGTEALTSIDVQSSGTVFYIRRAFLPFDSSVLGTGAIVSAGVFKGYTDTIGDSYSSSVCLVSTTQADPTVMVVADYGKSGTTELATRKTFASIGSNSAYDMALNATGISNVNVSGYSKFGQRISQDRDDSPVGVGSGILRQHASAAASNKPYYQITYSITDVTSNNAVKASLYLANQEKNFSLTGNTKTTYYSGMNYDWKPAGTDGAKNKGFNS